MDFWYPHTVTVTPRGQAVDPATKRAGNLSEGGTATVDCDVQRKTTDEAALMFGLDLKSPAALFCPLGDRDKFPVNAKVTKGADVFSVAAEPIVADDGFGLDHCIFPLEGLQVTQ